jgi:glycosyltransferase involved in cell wall biosynthesis
MKRILLYTPWENRWRKSLKEAFERKGWEAQWFNGNGTTDIPDVIFSMWADELVINTQKHLPIVPLFTYIRSYETYGPYPNMIDWTKISGLFFCGKHVQEFVHLKWPHIKDVPQMVIANWIDINDFEMVDKPKGNDIAMVCNLNFKKDLPFALRLIKGLSKYRLHIAGEPQDESLMLFCEHFIRENDLGNRVFFYGGINPDDISGFLSDKHYIISTSTREGCPMNILEGMACGLKPLVYNWPGAKSIFRDEYIFNDGYGLKMLLEGEYDPITYRLMAKNDFGTHLADKVADFVVQRVQ